MAWRILNMEHKTSDGFVIKVTSTYEKQDGPGYASELLVNEFEEVVGPEFIPYEDLTESTVIGWVQDSLGLDEVLAIQLRIDTLAATKKEYIENPPVQSGKPWA